jgi:hypothetical protein
MDYSKISKVVYHFEDSSTPPKYHRSYTITITAENIHTEVDVYGDVIATKDAKFSDAKFKVLLDDIKEAGIKKKGTKNDDGCTGGTGDYLELFDSQGQSLLDVYRYRCGGDDFGNMSGEIGKLKEIIKSLEPQLQQMLDEEYDG